MYDGLKLIGGGLLALVSSYIGLLVKRRYAEREKCYVRLCDFIAYARGELTSKMTTVPEICLAFAGENRDEVSDILRNFATGLRQGRKNEIRSTRLKEDEIKEISAFLNGLGVSSLGEQIAYIDAHSKTFQSKCETCKSDSKRLGNMYFKLFVLLGVALMVVTA